jgi:L-ascorbate metabolism protein UlaG (beta-lactamase superfamily)
MKKLISQANLLALSLILVIGCQKTGLESRTGTLKDPSSSLTTLQKEELKNNIDKLVQNIHWVEQACFRIDVNPYTVYIDPNSVPDDVKADLILITHPHGDHWSAAELDKIVKPNTILIAPAEIVYNGNIGQRIVLKPGEQVTAFGKIKIEAVPAYNVDKVWFHPKEANWVGYLVTTNGVTIYHAGDTERIPEMKTFTTDIALLSLGQTYTFNSVNDAAEAAKDVHAKVAIPMHFGLYEGNAADAITFKTLLDGFMPVVIKEKGQ